MSRAHILHVFQPQIGGVPGYVRQLTDGLLDRNWRVSVAGPAEHLDTWELGVRGVETLPLSLPRRPQPLRDARAIRTIAEHIRRANVNLVHTHSSKAGLVAALAARRARVPVVHTAHSWAFDMQAPRAVRVGYAAVERAVTRSCRDAIIAVSEHERNIALGWEVCGDAMLRVVRTGLPAAGVAPSRAEARAQLRLGDEEVVVAWVGRHAAQKRPRDLCALAELLCPRATVVALGSGLAGTSEGLELLIAGGRLVDEDVSPAVLYAAADLFVQTSAWEGLSLAIIEAMRAGLPVVAYEAGGTVEQVVHGETGFLTSVGDVPGIAAHVLDLAQNPTRRLAMGRAGADHFAWRLGHEQMLDGVQTVYADVLGRAGESARADRPPPSRRRREGSASSDRDQVTHAQH